MKNIEITTVEEIRKFLEGNEQVDFEMPSREEKYTFISNTLISTKYKKLRKKDRGIVKIFLMKVTGYEDKQMKRLIRRWKKSGLQYVKRKAVGASVCAYKPADIDLLIKTDILHRTPNGLSTKAILLRELVTFGHIEYQNISNISVSHIYNVRQNNLRYTSSDAMLYTKTRAASTDIGERMKPMPYGKPGESADSGLGPKQNIRCIRGTRMEKRVCITSISWMKLPSGNWLAVCHRLPMSTWSRYLKQCLRCFHLG